MTETDEEPTRRERALAVVERVREDSKLHLQTNKRETALVWRLRKRGRRPVMSLKLTRKIGKDEYGLILRVKGIEFRIGLERSPQANNFVRVVIDAPKEDVRVIREEIADRDDEDEEGAA